MKPEMTLLLWAAVLALVQAVVAVQGAVVAEKTNGTTLLGAQIFLYARIAYAFVYIAGLPWVRTATWGVSVVGLAMIFAQLI